MPTAAGASRRQLGFDSTGEFTYNGYTFTGAHQITVSEDPILDDAKRTVKYSEITITVTAVVADEDSDGDEISTDDLIEGIRKKLCVVGAPLTFKNKGFGSTMVVNKSADGTRDVNFGPIPGEFRWAPIGNDLACEIQWSVKVHLPECAYYTGYRGIRALTFDMSFDVDDAGDTTRTISGGLEIAMTINKDGKTIPDTADAYWKQIYVEPIPGFKRSTRRGLNKSKNTLEFTIIDQQIKSRNAYPMHVTDISGTHRVSWSKSSKGSLQHINNLSVKITPEARAPGEMAWVIFLALVRQRMSAAYSADRQVFLQELSATEDIWGRDCNFTATWRVIGCVRDFLGDSGLWKPVVGTDWRQWTASLQQSAFSRTGSSNLHHRPDMDVVVDLCDYQKPKKRGSHLLYLPNRQYPRLGLYNKKPPAEDSWVDMDMNVQIGREFVVDNSPTLQPRGQDATGDWQKEGGEKDTKGLRYKNKKPRQGEEDILESSKESTVYATFFGNALRLGHEISRPHLSKVGEQEVKEVKSNIVTKALGNYLGQTLFGMTWNIVYKLPAAPEKAVHNQLRPDDCIGYDKPPKRDTRVKELPEDPSLETVNSWWKLYQPNSSQGQFL